MKIKFILILTILTQNLNAQNHLYIDEKGSEINKTELRKKLLNDSLLLSSWSYTDKEGNRITTLKKDLYLTGVFKYYDIKRQLEKVTGREVKENTTLLIEYYFKDDLCTASRDNYWSKTEILHRKNFTTPIRNNIQKKKIIYIALFEEGITLRNNTNNKNEYFFSDQGNFFRKKIFINPTTCGSLAIIKPNGQTLIRNGEYRADYMIEYLKSGNWELFFSSND